MNRVRTHFKEHEDFYIGLGLGLTIAGITYLIMRSNLMSNIRGDVIASAKGDAIALGKNSTLNQVSYIFSERKGPPSWIIKCLETGEIFTSQNQAAETMHITKSNISRQLNGLQPHAQGYTFERIGLAI